MNAIRRAINAGLVSILAFPAGLLLSRWAGALEEPACTMEPPTPEQLHIIAHQAQPPLMSIRDEEPRTLMRIDASGRVHISDECVDLRGTELAGTLLFLPDGAPWSPTVLEAWAAARAGKRVEIER